MWRRGADSLGNVANFVESEQLLQTGSGFTASYIQVSISGQIPESCMRPPWRSTAVLCTQARRVMPHSSSKQETCLRVCKPTVLNIFFFTCGRYGAPSPFTGSKWWT